MKSTASSTYATLANSNTVNDNANSKLPLSGGFVNGTITMQTGSLNINAGNIFMNNNNIFNVNLNACNSGVVNSGGTSSQFLKADGTTDDTTYFPQTSGAALEIKTQNQTATALSTALTGAVSAISVAGNSVSWTTSGSYTADTVSISANQTAGARFTLLSPF